ncbi:MAG: hypothetical protein IPI12_06430 [Ignavibacteriales bacterium]|nr:hypothetical protein [Ignavibacteriales bacterium]
MLATSFTITNKAMVSGLIMLKLTATVLQTLQSELLFHIMVEESTLMSMVFSPVTVE